MMLAVCVWYNISTFFGAREVLMGSPYLFRAECLHRILRHCVVVVCLSQYRDPYGLVE